MVTTTKKSAAKKPPVKRTATKRPVSKPGYCPGCGAKTPVNSGPISRGKASADTSFDGEPGKGQLTTFCSYGCWLRHRKATGRD